MPDTLPSAQADTASLPDGTHFLDVFVADVNGLLRGKRLPAGAWARLSTEGVAFSRSALILDASGALQGPLGLGTENGDPDGNAVPVPGRLAPVPWAAPGLAQCLMSMRDEAGLPLWYDPREILRRVVARCRADGLHPVVSCELEFYLVGAGADGRVQPFAARRGGVARPLGGHLCLQQLDDYQAFLHDLHATLTAQGIPADTLVSEYGPGQFELNLLHGPDPVLTADQAVLQRRATVAVAGKHGLRASFMAKPFAQQAGSGLHIHVSLVDVAGRNRFGAPGGDALLGHAIAGMQALHAESMAIFAPSFSAYRRYRAGAFVAMGSTWGVDNRAVAFRVPRSGPQARRIEHRVAAADASPHLVMAAILAAIHYGVTGRAEPGPPVEPGHAVTGAQAGAPLPGDVFSALSVLEHGSALADYLPERFPSLFAELKRAEAETLFAEVQPVEHEYYL
jgi:glutamine synthetase